MTSKIEFLNFGLEQKLDHQRRVEFHGDSDGDGYNFPKLQLNPPKYPLGAPKMKFFNFGLEQKLDQQSCVDFYGDSDGNGFKAQKPIIDIIIGSNRP